MFRIAHISDLHIVHSSVNTAPSTLQKVAAAVGESVGFRVEASPYDATVFEALRLALRSIQPHALFITGDLTNYGDRASFQLFCKLVQSLKNGNNGIRVIAVPGNHDTLVERAAVVEKLNTLKAKVTRLLRHVNLETAVMARLAEYFPEQPTTAGMEFLATYRQEVERLFGVVDPAQPILLDVGWGKAAVFLFNSNVDDAFMANEGAIGRKRFNRIVDGLTRGELKKDLDGAIRIALLHHHPISAPHALDPAYERYYNWMKDGPLFLQFLNQQRFHLILHGHQHVPFTCSVTYRTEDDVPLHIVAAGSATQKNEASFNVVDLLSPFEIRVQRYDYDQTAFVPDRDSRCTLPIRARDRIRVTPHHTPEIAEDSAVRNLVLTSEDAHLHFQYDLIECMVKITADQRYIADYRYVGKAVDDEGANGPLFVIVGSPAMDIAAMKLKGFRRRDGKEEEVTPLVVFNHPTCKKLLVPSPKKLKPNDPFDVKLHFEWQASATEPNDFDGFNFMDMRYPIGKFVYDVETPWKPTQPCVREFALRKQDANADIEELPANENGCHRRRMTVEHPRPMVYLIFFGEAMRHIAWDC